MPETQRAPAIPDKLYFRIGEVSRLAKLEAYVLRFWEKEFPMLRPVKSNTGHRMYRRKDLELILEIKKLRQDVRQQKLQFPREEAARLKKVREELRALIALLSKSK